MPGDWPDSREIRGRHHGLQIRSPSTRSPAEERETARAWERFQAGEIQLGRGADALVLASWRRSRDLGIDPHGAGAKLAARGDALDQLREAHHVLLDVAAPIIAQAAGLLEGSGSILLLTSPDGIVLEAVGDNRTLDHAQRIHLVRGADWREAVVGTNGIGTALARGAPSQVHGHEHYCEGIQRWTCAAAPVLEPGTGRVLGVVDISGPPWTYQRSCLMLVLALAGQMAAALADRQAREEARLLAAALERFSSSDLAQGVVVLDRAGRLAHATGRLALPLSIGQELPGINAALPIEQWAGRLPDWLSPESFRPVRAGREAIGAVALIGERRRARPALAGSEGRVARSGFDAIIGRSAALQAVVARARLLAPHQVPVLIEGETGVGKELFARAIHSMAAPEAPFVVMNCGAVARDLLASELFGHARGAFTGATESRVGRFELADGGILCLDEIGELPLELQAHFLRVLEGGIVYRVGETRPRQVTVRLIAVTNRNLAEEVEQGRFRRDLYHRIGVTRLTVPPLRDHAEDIPLLVDHLSRILADRHRLVPQRYREGALARLAEYGWPGNVRELRNVVEALLLTMGGAEIDAPALDGLIAPAAAVAPGTLDEAERHAIERTIDNCAGNMAKAARRLGISRSTLYRKMERLRPS